jgi:hypothetical protein
VIKTIIVISSVEIGIGAVPPRIIIVPVPVVAVIGIIAFQGWLAKRIAFPVTDLVVFYDNGIRNPRMGAVVLPE